jgi:hypothetical protein
VLEQVLEQEQEPGLVLEMEPGQVPERVPGLRIQRPPIRLTGPLSLPEKIIFYSI